jgi:hypothetical protein
VSLLLYRPCAEHDDELYPFLRISHQVFYFPKKTDILDILSTLSIYYHQYERRRGRDTPAAF